MNKPQGDDDTGNDNLLLGVVLMALGMAVLNSVDAISKLLMIDYTGI